MRFEKARRQSQLVEYKDNRTKQRNGRDETQRK